MHDICVHCGKFATTSNSVEQPTCVGCHDKKPKNYICSKCKSPMGVRKGKFGYFWGCTDFPRCNHTVSLRKAFNKEKELNN